jgi:hypothetical protein
LSGPPAWSQLSPTGFPPAHFDGSRAIYDPIRDRMLVSFGELLPSSLWGLNFSDSPTPTLVSLVSAEALPGLTRITWQLSSASEPVDIERRSAADAWRIVGSAGVDGGGRVVFEDRAVRAGERYGYRMASSGGAGEAWVQIPPVLELSLRGPVPNPSGAALTIAFALPSGDPAKLEVVDLAGRRVAAREVGSLGAGSHVVNVSSTPLAPGLYLIRLTQGARTRSARAVVLR